MCVGRHQEVCKIWSSGNFSKEVPLPNSASAVQASNVSDNSRITTFPPITSLQRAIQRAGNKAVLQMYAPFIPTSLWRLKCPDRRLDALSATTQHFLGMLVLQKVLASPPWGGRAALIYQTQRIHSPTFCLVW